MSATHHDHKKVVRTYITVFVSLMALGVIAGRELLNLLPESSRPSREPISRSLPCLSLSGKAFCS